MSRDAHSPITTLQRLPRPFNGTIYTTIRVVSPEKPLPLLGSTMEAELGVSFAASRVISVQKAPPADNQSNNQLVIQHAVIPSETDQLLTNWEVGEEQVGSNRYEAVFRTVILLASEYDNTLPAINQAMPIGSDGKFDEQDYVFYGDICMDSGASLEPVFRVVRRTYIRKIPFVDLEINRETGEAQQITIQHFGRGEEVTGSSKIEDIADDPDNAYWNLDENGYGNVVKQISENWWEVTQRQWINTKDVWEWGMDRRGPKRFFRPATDTTTTVVTTGNAPGPLDPLPTVEDGTMIQIMKWGEYMRYTTVVRSGYIGALSGEEYGDIVTKSVSEDLVPDETEADTGIDVISSVVEPQENGQSTKVTKRVKGGEWPDPVEEAMSRTRDNLIPQKFRNFVTRLMVSRKVADTPESITLTGNEIGKEYTRETPDRVDVKVTEEILDDTTEPLEGKVVVSTYGGGVADTSEELVADGEEPESGFEVLSSSVTPLGNGKSIKESVIMQEGDAFPVLNGSKYDETLGIDLPFSEEVIEAGETPATSDVDPIDKWRSKRRTYDTDAIKASLESVHIIYPTQQTVQLPNVLKNVKVIASRTLGNGNGYTSGSSGSLRFDSNVSVSADLLWEVEEGFSGPVDAEVHVFFLPIDEADPEAIFERVGAAPWPLYRPKSHRLVITGHGISKSYDITASSGGFGASESSSVTALTNAAILPQCINGEIEVDVDYIDLESPTTVLDAAVDDLEAKYTALNESVKEGLDSGFYLGTPVTPDQAAAIEARLDQNLDILDFVSDLDLENFPVTVTPSIIPATSPASVAAGKYVYRSSAEPYSYGMVRVTAVVVNITEEIL